MIREDQTWQFTTIGALAARAAEVYGEATAIEDGRHLSFRQLDAARREAARAMLAAGVRKGDRVMIWAPNSWKWFVAALGLVSVGAVLVPASTRFKGLELGELIGRSGADVLFSAGSFLGQYYPDMLSDETRAALRHRIVLDHARPGDTTWEQFLAGAATVPDADLARAEAAVGPDDLCDMLFTSGTTGHPKGVMYCHRQCLRAIDAWATRVGIRSGDRMLVIPPFFHAFGYRSGAIVAMMRGAVLLPHLTFDAEEILRRVAAEAISVIAGPPTIFHSMLKHPDLARFDRRSLRLGVTGGTVVPASLIRRMREELGFAGVVNGYGLTECGGYGTMCSASDPDEVVANTAGKPCPGVEVAIMDGAGRLLPPGEPGEVVLRGYIVMQGYYNDPEATAKTIDAAGWLHSGDVGHIDANGDLHIQDRLKDIYICGGFNCYPAEIERLLSAHPAINQIAVIGVPDERLGEVGHAFVVLRPGAEATEAGIIAWARAHIANFKVPRRVEFREALPTSPQGKVLKTVLREAVAAAAAAAPGG
jgi:acyl-CoA synthetase (AMP-forming)/AMP-acid ligase II